MNILPRIYLIRHGETEWSASGRYTGTTDLPLTPSGEQAARSLGKKLSGIRFDHIFSSPMLRARQTCEHAFPSGVYEIEPNLAEWNYGALEGLSSGDVHLEHPDWNLFRDGAPQGETPSQVSARVDLLIQKLMLLRGDLALFTHGHLGRVLAARWIGLPVREAAHWTLGTASVGILGFEKDMPDSPVIQLWNATMHHLA